MDENYENIVPRDIYDAQYYQNKIIRVQKYCKDTISTVKKNSKLDDPLHIQSANDMRYQIAKQILILLEE